MGVARTSVDATVRADELQAELPEEELWRAQLYGLLARLLAGPPDEALLNALARAHDDATELGRAMGELASAAKSSTADAASEEYHTLFIGMARGEFVPYASYYLSGFLNDRALAAMRRRLELLGVTRAEGVMEPEDHIAALLEVMAGLISGAFGDPAPLGEQREVFEAHLAPWGARFFTDLEKSESAVFYAAVGRVGRLFLGIETTAFAMT